MAHVDREGPDPLRQVGAGLRRWVIDASRDVDRQIVGRAYLADHETERDVARLIGLIAAPMVDGDVEFRDWLRHRVAEDFDQGRTTVVRGWILALTEARLLGLGSLFSTTG